MTEKKKNSASSTVAKGNSRGSSPQSVLTQVKPVLEQSSSSATLAQAKPVELLRNSTTSVAQVLPVLVAKPENKWEASLKNAYSLKSMIDLVKYPVITEKSYFELYKKRQYTFDLDKRLTKTQIKKLVESLFNINVIAVNTHIPPRQKIRVGVAQGYRPSYKKAIITLKEGQSINYSFPVS